MDELVIADVDGVFTDDQANPNKEAITLSAVVGRQRAFTYATGRSAGWLRQKLGPVLLREFAAHPPRYFLVCAEYGCVRLIYDREDRNFDVDWRYQSPIDGKLRAGIQADIARIPGVFFDDDKEVMISVEARHDMWATEPDVVASGLQQTGLYLASLTAQLRDTLEYHATTYARDLAPAGFNKAHAAEVIIERLPFVPTHVHLLGDAKSDLLLAEPLIKRSLPFTFHFVGKIDVLDQEQIDRCHVVFSKSRYGEGTVEVLKSLL